MAEVEAAFPIRYPTDTSGIKSGISELERLRSALQEDQKQIAGLQKAMASLRLDPDVKAYIKMQEELKKAGIEAEKSAEKLKELKEARATAAQANVKPKELEKLDSQIEAEQARYDKATAAVERHKKGIAAIDTKPAVQQYKDLDTSLKHTEAQLAENQSKYLAAGGDMTKMGEQVKGGMEKLTEGADAAGIGVSGLKQKFESLKALGPAGLVAAVVVAVVALGVALAKTTYDLAKFALEAGDAARSTSILMEAAAGSQAGGKELGAMVRRLRNDFAGSREEIAGMVLELRRSGLQGAYLEKTVRLAGIAAKTMGEGASGILKGLIERGAMSKRFVLNPFDLRGTGLAFNDVAGQLAKMTGRTVGQVRQALQNGQVKLADGIVALEAAVKFRFGDLAKRQLLALPEQFARARENLRDIFAGVDTSKFLMGMAKVLDLLDETTETGKTLRTLAKTIFQPLLDFAGSTIMPMIRGFFLGMALAVIELSIATIKAYLWFKKTFGDTSLFKGIDGAKLAFYAGAAAVFVMVAAVGALVSFFAGLGVAIAVVTAPIWSIGVAIYKVVKSVWDLTTAIPNAFTNLGKSFKDVNLSDAILGITNGIIKGIQDAGSAVAKAFTDLAKSGVDAFKSALGIASPAKVLRAEAKWIGPGVAQGVDDGQQVVSQAMARLVEPSDALPQGGASSNAARGAISVVIEQLNVMADAAGKINRASLEEQLVEVFEGVQRRFAMRPA